MNTRILFFSFLLGSAALATGCHPHATLRTPSGFAVLEDQEEYVYRATSAEGVVLGVRAEKNKPRGNLDFWADAVDRQLRNSGYVTEGKTTEVRSTNGLAGRQNKYVREEQGRKQRFWTVVFVTEGRVWIVEAGGDADRFNARTQDAVQKAIESISMS